jgi:MFS family permease
MSSGSQSGLIRAFRHRDFAIYACVTWFSNVGMWIMRIGLGWLTWHLTQSGAWLGAIAAAQALPSVLLTPIAGSLADRMDQVKIMRVTQLISGFLAAFVAFATFEGWVSAPLLAAYSLLHGTSFAIGMPSRVTIGPNLVPREDISAAIAVGSVIFGSSMFLGPAISGILIDTVGIAWTFTVNAIAYFVMYGGLALIRLLREEKRQGPPASIWTDTMEGIRFVAHHRGIMRVMVMALIMSLLVRPLADMMPGFADKIFHRPTEGLATLMAAFGLGAMAGSLYLANRNKLEGTVALTLTGVLLSALLNILIAATDIYWLAVASMFAVGATAAFGFNGCQILVQNAAAGPMRGRVMSLYSYNFQGIPALGAMVMGTASSYFGLQAPVIVGGVLSLVIWFWVFQRRREIKMDMEVLNEAPGGRGAPAGEGAKPSPVPAQ